MNLEPSPVKSKRTNYSTPRGAFKTGKLQLAGENENKKEKMENIEKTI